MTTHDSGNYDPDDRVDLDAEPVLLELPGEPIEPGTPHHTYLVESAAATPEYLAQPHVAEALRRIARWEQLPMGFRSRVDVDEASGLIFGWDYPTPTTPQYRPDRPPVNRETGKPDKYLFLRRRGASAVLRSDPRDVGRVGSRVHICEGPKQSLALGSALMGTDEVVVGTPGCWGYRENGVISPEVTALIKGAAEVVMWLDTDAARNRRVYDAGIAFKKTATRKGRTVRFAQVPQVGEDTHTGIDDYLATIDPKRRAEVVESLVDAALDNPALERPAVKVEKGSPESFFSMTGQLLSQDIAEALLSTRLWLLQPKSGRIAVYDPAEGVYRINTDESADPVRDALIDLLGNKYHKRHLETIRDVVTKLLIERGRVPTPQPPDWLHVANGWLHKPSRQLHPHTPERFSLHKLGVPFITGATAPKIVAFLARATTLEDGTDQVAPLIDTLSQIVEPEKAPEKALFLFGPPRSGKGTTTSLATDLIPEHLISAVPLAALATDRFAASGLYEMSMNVIGEQEQTFLSDVSTFNKAMGLDLIWAQFKGKDAFKFTNTACWLMSGNDPMQIADTSGAVAARITPISFPESHVGREDRKLREKLTPELPGFLNMLLDAADAREARGNFLPAHPEVDALFRAKTNPVSQFLHECVELAPQEAWRNDKVIADEWLVAPRALYKAYEKHCKEVGRRPYGETKFLDSVRHPPFNIRQARTAGNRRGLACRLKQRENPFTTASGQPTVSGQRVTSWIDPKTGELCVLLPGVTDIAQAMRVPVPKTGDDDPQPPDDDPWGGTSPGPDPDPADPDTGGAAPEAEGADEPTPRGDAAPADEGLTEADDPQPEPEAVPADQAADEEASSGTLPDPPPWRPRDLLAEAERIVRASAEVVDVATAHRILDAEREAGEWMGKDSEPENWTQRDRERRERRTALMKVHHLTVTQVADQMGVPPRRARSLLRRLVTLLEPDIHLRERPQKVDPFTFRAEPGAVEDTAFAAWTCPIPAPTTGGAQ